ncbi:MAG: CAP domain-containing protein [Anaerolineaceae bacterium]
MNTLTSSRIGKVFLLLIACVLVTTLTACQLAQTINSMLATDTPTPTNTSTVTQTPTITVTVTPTATATFTLTPTATATSTSTSTPVPVATRKPAATAVSGGGSSSSCDGGSTSFEANVRALINQQRANAGLSTLSNSGALASAARAHSKDMAMNNYLSHSGQDGSTMESRVASAGYSYSALGEVIYGGQQQYNTPYSAVSWWMGSQSHHDVILYGPFTEVGVGYWCNEASSLGGYVTADFGRP